MDSTGNDPAMWIVPWNWRSCFTWLAKASSSCEVKITEATCPAKHCQTKAQKLNGTLHAVADRIVLVRDEGRHSGELHFF